MVRTKADSAGSGASRKVVAARAPRKALSSGNSAAGSDSPSGKNAKYAGGNPVCPRPTPEWQKGINSFFTSPSKGKENSTPDEGGEGSSKSSDTGLEKEDDD